MSKLALNETDTAGGAPMPPKLKKKAEKKGLILISHLYQTAKSVPARKPVPSVSVGAWHTHKYASAIEGLTQCT